MIPAHRANPKIKTRDRILMGLVVRKFCVLIGLSKGARDEAPQKNSITERPELQFLPG
jgi:hypothetical protein